MSDTLHYEAAEDRTLPAVTYALYLLALANGVTAVIGLIIAYANRENASERMRTHYEFLIRTFWLTIAGWVIGGALVFFGAILSVILIGIPGLVVGGLILALVGIWYAVRCIVGVIYLARGEAYPRPYALLA